MTKHPLDTFFSPGSIAIIGASRDDKKIPGLLLTFLRRNGFAGEIFPINPAYDSICDLGCFASVAAIGKPVDLAIVIIPARAVLGALLECAAAGVKNAIVISSGFAEEGGESAGMQAEIAELAKRTGMRISGPNAEGFYNEPQRIAATFSPTVDVRPDAPRLLASQRRVGIVAQSGGIGFAIYNRAKAMGVAVSKVISTGNESDLAAGEFLDYLVQDDATDVILMFIEGIRDPQMFAAAARRAAETGKPVIVIKVGRSGAGERAAASHTASLAGWTAAYDAVFAKYGFVVCNDLDEAVAIAAAFAAAPLPRGDRLAVVTVSGGAGAWVADALAGEGLQIPELAASMQEKVRALIPSYGSARNPVDITAQAVHSGGLQKVIELLEQSSDIDAIVVVVSLASETRIPVKADEIKPLIDAQRKPILFFTYTLPSQFARTELAASGIVAFSGITSLGRAVSQLVKRSRYALAPQVEAHPSRLETPVPGRLSEHESKALLRNAGIDVPQEILVRDKAALAAALSTTGFPVAMKIQSRDIPHKSEAGGVQVNIRDADEAAVAYDALIGNARRFNSVAGIQGVLVGPMAGQGVEMIIGTINDPTFGPIIMTGLGGIATELFRDVVYRPAPVSEAEAAAMVAELKSAALLDGFRGAAKADKDALIKLIARISLLAAELKDSVSEIEINPARVHEEGKGVTIVDALIAGKAASAG
ncbi:MULTISPECIES: acetate--CoA ligase family protein [unclassified Afipia]|uniref:acetate--CoA ligase family protein n=1 Tax=unclassified Afipia TaxID=2642050 RepID=UPI000410B4B2|nr:MULTISPECIES: acetate--CoA ligase family protein [unclassified Afipia]